MKIKESVFTLGCDLVEGELPKFFLCSFLCDLAEGELSKFLFANLLI